MISRMTCRLSLAILPLLLGSCGLTREPQAPGELGRQFTSTIPGAWSGTISRNGLECRMIKQYKRDGSAQGVLLLKKSQGRVSFVMPEIPFKSRWRVKGDVVETYGIETGIPGLFKPGEVIRDKLVSVSQNRISWRAVDSGNPQTITRLESSR
ncbi:MAG: hypothetical protein EOP88_03595 [Verrucomicrobiaceae bacterium]|nr:MAG: hypothetical protein EOP88_03595 [Verrucomicrobiaceae bacterium]